MGRALTASLVLAALSCVAQAPQALFRTARNSPIAVGQRPADVAAADVNGDGNRDLITANLGDNNVTVLLGNGRGSFRPAPGSPVAAGFAPHLVVAGDLDADGTLDLALTSHDSNDVVVLLGNGRGSFAPASGSPFPLLRGTEPHNHGLTLADVNGDTRLDILTSNHNHHSVSVLLNDGRGRFAAAPGSPFPVGRDPYNHSVGDVNGDGHPDVAVPNLRSNSISFLLGDGRGGFRPAPASPLPVLTRPYFAGLADLNRDRKLDLIATHDDIHLVTILLGDGRGRFQPAPGSPYDAGRRGGRVAVADVDVDAKLDLVMGATGDVVVVLLGNGRGGCRPAPGSPFPAGRGPWGTTLADVNGDRRLDILAANFEHHNVTVLLGQR